MGSSRFADFEEGRGPRCRVSGPYSTALNAFWSRDRVQSYELELRPAAYWGLSGSEIARKPSFGYISPLEKNLALSIPPTRSACGSISRSRTAKRTGSFLRGRSRYGLPPGAFPPRCERRRRTRSNPSRALAGSWRLRHGPAERGSAWSRTAGREGADPGRPRRLAADSPPWIFEPPSYTHLVQTGPPWMGAPAGCAGDSPCKGEG